MKSQIPNPKSQTAKHAKDAKTGKGLGVLSTFFASFALFALFVVPTSTQQLLDRVVARVGTTALTQTDVDFAVAFGGVDPKAGDPVKQMIARRLVIAEVNRFPPPEPAEMAINELVAKMKATAGTQATAVMRRTGVEEKGLQEFARETLRIQAYLLQRFGTGARADQQMARWLNDLRARGDVTEVTPRPERSAAPRAN
jgi:hypothetical protein